MAVFRPTPLCTFCNEPTHKEHSRDMSNVPISERVFGDNFIGWIPLNHTCKGLEEFKKVSQGIWKNAKFKQ
jgi:hypothetical protein